MSSKREKRITNEIRELEKSVKILEQSGIYFHYDEININIIYAMLLGPEKTPYEKGFYFFKFEYPLNYPMEPPKTKYCTQGNLRNPHTNAFYQVRFNPNLYVCGKVCLSMLNTWAGPGWVPTNTITNVMVAIQALVLNDYPLQNEPGFENAQKKDLEKYNEIIAYANISTSVIGMINNTPPEFIHFKPKMNEIFMKNMDFYRNFVLTKNDLLQNSVIESPAYGMKVAVNYGQLLYEIGHIEDTIKMTENLENMKISSEVSSEIISEVIENIDSSVALDLQESVKN